MLSPVMSGAGESRGLYQQYAYLFFFMCFSNIVVTGRIDIINSTMGKALGGVSIMIPPLLLIVIFVKLNCINS